MKKVIASVMFALTASTLIVSGNAVASGAAVQLEPAKVDLENKASLQRGVKYYVNYCMGCHALSYSRYNRVANDLDLTEAQVAKNLIFTRTDGEPTKVGELMKNAMPAKDAS